MGDTHAQSCGSHRGLPIIFEGISFACRPLYIGGETSERKVRNQIDRILDRPRTIKEKKLSEAFTAREAIKAATHYHGTLDHWHANREAFEPGHSHIESASDMLHKPATASPNP